MKRAPKRRWLHDNSLSLVLSIVFLIVLAGQTLAGWLHYNQENLSHQKPAISLPAYLETGAFGEAVFENWESEFLQMALCVVLTVFLFQKGSSESKDPGSAEKKSVSVKQTAPWPVRRGGIALAIYKHSLSLALFFLFALSFAGHAVCGLAAVNEEAALHGLPASMLGGWVLAASHLARVKHEARKTWSGNELFS